MQMNSNNIVSNSNDNNDNDNKVSLDDLMATLGSLTPDDLKELQHKIHESSTNTDTQQPADIQSSSSASPNSVDDIQNSDRYVDDIVSSETETDNGYNDNDYINDNYANDSDDIEEDDDTISNENDNQLIDDVPISETIAKRHEAAAELGSGDELTDIVFDDGIYLAVPKIPEQYRSSDIIGKRTQASSSSNAIPIGPIKPKPALRRIWDGLSDIEKYLLMLVSEHRQLTLSQLNVLICVPSKHKNNKKVDATKTYYRWITEEKYEVSLRYSSVFSVTSPQGLRKKIEELVGDNLLARILPAYDVNEKNISDRYKEMPSLFTEHYYLTPLAAKVLICCTDINKTNAKVKPIGYVPTYKKAAYQTILHESETTEILCSLVSCCQYASNPDDKKEYGLFDVCRFYHEKDVEEKDVVYKGKKIVFKSDGKIVLYSEALNDFLDFYIEYDSGSSTKDKIKHKTEAFIKYIFWMREKYGDRFRKPILLLATQKPADLFPQLHGRKSTTYTTGIKNMAKECFPEYLNILNDFARVLIADCGSIRNYGTLGACWHKVDLTTGIAELKAYDLITAATMPFDESE